MKLILFTFLIATGGASASTFVGNGGGQGDVELSVTKRQIKETMNVIVKGGDNLCRCNSAYQNRSVCDALSNLSPDEIRYCAAVLKHQAPEILKLIQDNSGVTYRWTNSSIEVKEGGKTRAVDAVTDPAKKEITLNINRFQEMKPFERVFLLSHELAHLTEFKGQPLVDEGPMGEFKGKDGGRRLLNAMGSAAAILQADHPVEIRGYSAALRRSKSWKSRWIELNGGTASYTKSNSQTFASDRYERGQVIARYNFGDFGVLGGFRHASSDRTALDTITVKEKMNIASLGVSYRFFPFSEPLTAFGQSHLQLQAMVDFVFAEVRLSEEMVPDLSEKKSAVGGNVSLNYYFPIAWGLWPYIGVGYEYHPFKYSKVNIDNDSAMTSVYLGGAYAF